jgi:hypothetical protein
MNPRAFTFNGLPFALVGGRKTPGLPSMHIVRADTGAHVSLAYEDGDGVLFDDKLSGFRLNADGTVTRYAEKGQYYQARRSAGWPLRKRRGKA